MTREFTISWFNEGYSTAEIRYPDKGGSVIFRAMKLKGVWWECVIRAGNELSFAFRFDGIDYPSSAIDTFRLSYERVYIKNGIMYSWDWEASWRCGSRIRPCS